MSLKSPLLIYGAGGHARVLIEAAIAAGLRPTAALDDHPKVAELAGVKVIQPKGAPWAKWKGFRFVVAIGDNLIRARLFEQLQERGGVPQTVVHPFSWISPSARLGDGTVIFGGVVVNADALIGENCILNTGCSVDHDCNIGAHSHLCPGVRLAGTVTIGRRTMVGTGASCIPGIKIGSDVTIGAGAVVVRDLPDKCTAFGTPARAR